MSLRTLLMAEQVARELACSRIVIELQSGLPAHDGRYLCVVDIEGSKVWRLEQFEGGQWVTAGAYSDVQRWAQLPPIT